MVGVAGGVKGLGTLVLVLAGVSTRLFLTTADVEEVDYSHMHIKNKNKKLISIYILHKRLNIFYCIYIVFILTLTTQCR